MVRRRWGIGLAVGWLAVVAGAAEQEPARLYEMAMVAKARGDLSSADRLLGQVLSQEPQLPEALWAMAWLQAQTGRTAEAAAWFWRVLAAPGDPSRQAEARAALARLGYGVGQDQPAGKLPWAAHPLPAPPGRYEGAVQAVDPATGAILLSPGMMVVTTGRPGLGWVDAGRGERVAMEQLSVGDRVSVEFGEGTAVTPRVETSDTTPRLRWQGVPYTQEVTQQDVARELVLPFLGRRSWNENYGKPLFGRMHLGLDISAPRMTPLLAVMDGVVRQRVAASAPGKANSLVIGDGAGWTALYTHLNDDRPGTKDNAGGERYAFAPGIVAGSRVVAGQLLGWVGDSGNATGPHLHLEIREPDGMLCNPSPALKRAQVLTTPRLAPIAARLHAPAGLTRWDGWLSRAPGDGATFELALRATVRPEGRTVAPTKPETVTCRAAAATCRVLGVEGAEVPVASLREGDFVVVHGKLQGRVVEVQQVYAAVAGVWLSEAGASARP